MPSYHTNASQVAESFDSVLTTGALGLGSVLIAQRLELNAAYNEAAYIRRQAAVVRARRVAAAVAAEVRAGDDRLRDAILRKAIAAKRTRG
ncbi:MULTISPECIES: hypothetical protein [Methylobacteriaceae]|uniref:Tryptophan synthase beta subunit n=1 Tax=Methylorubrum thiocyanatum TaxID=47958 RepID=A0AA40S5S7_9HYPH|nr:hypothetical protein [Methylorubrum thiocyanatum]MBA8914974.1 tryptophan synthase beta subunit [Methylorubrum thiocyanatum]GJE79381.1 hypothetical protein CJNNKLLH_0707 [Methylorubrum thiocyanatum]